ncbi:MAG: hypothetical protein RBU29_08465 [bacterium]|nr:hypothetical protein [bacterium]
MKALYFTGALLLLLGVGWAQAEPFTPGNLVLVDAAEDRLIEVTLGETEATVVQVVKWALGDTSRRRPLGVAFDPNGTCYVGITGVPTSATEQVDYPAGRGEVLRIKPDGTQDFFILPPEVTKGTWVSSFAPNEVFVMSNEPPPPPPSHSFLLKFSGNEIVKTTLFDVSMTLQGNGNVSHGKAMVLPDGRILIPNGELTNQPEYIINVFGPEGGAPKNKIVVTKSYRSLAYLEGSNEMLAIPGTGYVDRISMDGTILGSFDFALDGLGGVWNFTLIEDGTERFIATNHNGPAGSKSMVFIYDSKRLNELPLPQILDIVGLKNFGDADGLATSLFDHAIVPVPSDIPDWTLF